MRFKYPDGALKTRKTLEKVDGKHQMFWDPPGKAGQLPFLPANFEPQDWMFIFEGETDTMAAWQSAPPEAQAGMVGLSGTDAFAKWTPEYLEEMFGKAKTVFVVMDNEDPYDNADAAASVERGWAKIQDALGRKARRVVLPQGINDVAEFFQTYDWAAFRVLLKKAREPKRFYKRLDLSKDAPPTDWLVEDFAVRHEATVLAGDGGVGKSFITMQLALAVASGQATFLDLAIKRHGRVLYVDEENSADLILQRLNALSRDMFGEGTLPPQVRENLEYLWYAGVDLLNEPEKLREEALDLQPELVIIDSLSRVALGAEENSNPDMTKLMRAGVVPIARDTGAAVILVHHTDKDGRGPRGASAIRNSADQVISVIPALDKNHHRTGKVNIFPSKPRRLMAHLEARITGDIANEGWVRVERAEEEDPF